MHRPPNNRIVRSLALGAVTTIAVAWALAVVRPIPGPPRMTGRTFILHDRAWNTSEHHVLGATDIWWMDLGGSSTAKPSSPTAATEKLATVRKTIRGMMGSRPNYRALESPPPWGTLAAGIGAANLPPTGVHGADTAFGFPLPCLWHRATAPLKGNMSYAGGLDGGILLRGTAAARGPNDYTALPLRPIWTALVLDSVVYAVVWLLVLTGFDAMRARRRVRRGMCPQCAYDLSGTAVERPCSECGTLEGGRRRETRAVN